MDSIRGVLSFVRSVDLGSFAAAGRALGITAVGVSKNVQRLEQDLGVKLLRRSTRRLSLTEDGRRYYEQCAAPLQALELAHRSVKLSGTVPAGEVRVTSVSAFGRTQVVPLLARFARLHPQIRVVLDLDDAVVDMIEHPYDLGIRLGPLPSGDVIVREIARIPFVMCASPGYLSQRGTPADLSDLAAHNCLRLYSRTRSGPVDWPLAQFSQARIAAEGDFLSNDLSALVAAACHGQGIAMAPLPLVLPLFRAGSLVPVLPQHVWPGHPVYLHYPNRRGLPKRVRVLIDFLFEQLRTSPDLQPAARDLVQEQ